MNKEFREYLAAYLKSTATYSHLQLLDAVEREREACAKIIENSKAHNFTLQQLANKIRARE